ncbi:MAG: thymidylate synthase [Promethearchaeota archaeon]
MASVIFIEEEDVGSAWLEALRRVLEEGDDIKTEYDRNDTPPSKDSTVLIKVRDPFKDPIRRRGGSKSILKIKTKYGNTYEVYGCLADIFLIGSIQSGYIEEVLEGSHDRFLWESEKSFPYSYHDRIYNYTAYSLEDSIKKEYNIKPIGKDFVKNHKKLHFAKKVVKKDGKLIWNLPNGIELNLEKDIAEQIGVKDLLLSTLDLPRINQINLVIEKLKKKPYTRRAQATTWRPYADPFSEDPPCLQRLFFRIKNNKLILQTCWRSRDLFKAWEPNVNAMIRIQKMVANAIGVEVGEYIDFSNSLHIYGQDIENVKKTLEQISLQNKLHIYS